MSLLLRLRRIDSTEHAADFTRSTANVPTTAKYQANNIVGLSKRAVGSALLVGGGGVGGIIASLIFRQKDYPHCEHCSVKLLGLPSDSVTADIPGVSGTIGFQVLLISIVGTLSLWYKRQNRLADEGKVVLEGTPGFRYTI